MIQYDMKSGSGEFRAENTEQYLTEFLIINNSLIQILKEKGISDSQLEEMLLDIGNKYGLRFNTRISAIAGNIDDIKLLDALLEKGMDNDNEDFCIFDGDDEDV